MAVEMKKSSGIPLCAEPNALCRGPHVNITRARRYIRFDERLHGQFAVLHLDSGPTCIHFLRRLLPLYCRLCFLSQCHSQAEAAARALLTRVTLAVQGLTGGQEPAQFEIRTLEYLLNNLVTSPPAEVGEVTRSSDVSVESKIAVELLWSHLVLVYAGNRKLLLYNWELFLTRPQEALELCPAELRAALFTHGKHDPVCQRKQRHDRQGRRRLCPVSVTVPHDQLPTGRRRMPRGTKRLYETRFSRICWLAALWLLDLDCNKRALHWIYKPEPQRALSECDGS
ncbi:hypothetical protein WMY93_011361 [Mugilogobius chulae]|uniref:Uncharacterized protein n=1 Tax=Mugilogobius chulae TaxID=88201 RepID=A0AAW0P3S3_9GOBI